jgi:hypothetical protein
MGNTPQEQIVGLLHDVLEDCDEVWHRKVQEFATPAEYVALELLSRKVPGTNRTLNKRDDDYYAAIGNNQLARTVKLNDIRHNTSPERLNSLEPEEAQRLAMKYLKAVLAIGMP